MPGPLGSVLTFLGVSAGAGLILCWARLAGAWRRGLAVLASAAGLLSLILAVRSEGSLESPTTATFLIGASYVTEQASASASLRYYVLTVACLLLGTAGLAVGDELARRIARSWLATAVALSVAVTALRFLLEKAAAPPSWTYPVGVTWLVPAVGAFFAWNLRDEGKGIRALAAALFLYGLAVRGFVVAVYAAATTLRLGSHYDISRVVRIRNPWTDRLHEFAPGGFEQLRDLVLVPQLGFWPLFTVAAGLVAAGLVLGVTGAWRPRTVPTIRPQVTALGSGKAAEPPTATQA